MTAGPATDRSAIEPGEVAAALDLLLTDAALGRPAASSPVSRGCGSSARWPAGRARLRAAPRPGGRARPGRRRYLRGCPVHAGTGASPTRPGRRTRCCAGSCRPTSPPGAPPRAGRRRGPGLARHRADRLPGRQPGRGAAPTNNPLLSPGGVEGGDRLRRGERAAPGCAISPRDLAARPRVPTMVPAGRLRGRRRPRVHARARSCGARRSSS